MTTGENCSARNATNSRRLALASLTNRARPLWFGWPRDEGARWQGRYSHLRSPAGREGPQGENHAPQWQDHGRHGGIERHRAATAKAAARENARLVLLARNQAKLEEVAEKIRRNGGAAHVYLVDLTVAEAVAEVAKKITAEVGTPDIIFNNAGVGKWLSVEETDPDEAVKMMASPYFAAFFVTRAFLPEMLKQNSGYIVNMTSAASRLVCQGYGLHRRPMAMHGFTEGLRADLTGTGIRVMLASFAKVASSYWENNPGSEERLPKAQSMIRVLTPEEAAQAIIGGIKRTSTKSLPHLCCDSSTP